MSCLDNQVNCQDSHSQTDFQGSKMDNIDIQTNYQDGKINCLDIQTDCLDNWYRFSKWQDSWLDIKIDKSKQPDKLWRH